MASPEHQDEVKHRYEFVRHLFQIFITWFTVFSGLNLTVFGWIVGSDLKKGAPPGRLILLFAGMIIAQNLLALAACWFVFKEFRRTNKRLLKLTNTDSIAMPVRMYSTATMLVALGCITYLVAWFFLFRYYSNPIYRTHLTSF